jgi:K+:H+ antiporter
MLAMTRAGEEGAPSRRRLLAAYAFLIALAIAVVAAALTISRGLQPAPSVGGLFRPTTPSVLCLPGPDSTFELRQSGRYVSLFAGGVARAQLVLEDGALGGRIVCAGTVAPLTLAVTGTTQIALLGSVAERPYGAVREATSEGATTAPRGPTRSPEETFGRLMLAIAAVMLAARLGAAVVARLGQPRVMGEVLAGILLGPTFLGAVARPLQDYLFPTDIVPLLSAAAAIGLVFYMFIVGLELDPALLRGRMEQAAFVSHASIAVPMVLGIAAALPLYPILAPPLPFLPFALFMGVSMSITAFPVLARILIERRMLRRPVGALAIAAAAVDDVTAWGLLALSTAVAASVAMVAGAAIEARSPLLVVVLAVAFVAGMFLVIRPLLGRVSAAYDEAGHVPATWIGAIFVGILLAAFTASWIGIAYIFGAFVMGLIMPRRADLTHDVTRRIEDFVTTVLLPLFFVVTGLRTEVGLLQTPELWLITLGLIVIAIVGKWLGAMLAARFTGLGIRESAAIGALMNTRGLAELIVLNLALHLGIITPVLFTMLVIMALVTTFMTGPALRLIDPRNSFGEAATAELRRAEPATPEATRLPRIGRTILVAPQDTKNVKGLLRIAEPLGLSEPRRDVIVARLVVPRRAAGELASAEGDLARARNDLQAEVGMTVAPEVSVRVVVFATADPATDLVHIAEEQDVDLILLDGRRPLVGEAIPGGPVRAVLEGAACDVAVLVEREAIPEIGPERPVVVPFGGAEHDWAAVELAAWIANARGAPLRLVGATTRESEARSLLESASIVLRQLAGVQAESVVVPPAREDLMNAIEGSGLAVVGLSDRWRTEGLGAARSEIARSASVPVLFVRRGHRAGALASRNDVTAFSWSRAWSPPPELGESAKPATAEGPTGSGPA